MSSAGLQPFERGPIESTRSSRLCQNLDRESEKPHYFPDSHHPLTQRNLPEKSGSSTIVNADVEAYARRNQVERTMELYVFVSDERLNIRVNAALLAEAKEMGFRAGADLWTWFLDIGKVLGTMRQSCGPCHPWGQTLVKCLHTDELEAAARLKNIAKTSYRVADVYSARLGSQTKRRRMSARVAAETSRALLIATDKARQASRQRAQIIHRASYGDACEIFWLATAGHDRAYCLRE